MKQATRLSILFLIFLTVINIYVLFRNTNINSKDSIGQINNSQISFSRLESQLRETFIKENTNLNNSSLYLGLDSSVTFNLSDLSIYPRLVLSFSGDMCAPCIDFSINKVKEHFPKYFESDSILIICSNIEDKYKLGYYGKPIYSVAKNNPLPINIHVPTFYIFDEELVAKLYFIPDYFVPGLTDIYLKIIKERFFN